MKSCVAQFAKSPEFVPVKTRLQTVLSAEQAKNLHKHLVTHVADQIPASERFSHQLWSTHGGAFIESLCRSRGICHHIQVGESLGQRLTFASQRVLEDYDAVILVGSDCPFLTGERFNHVINVLENYDGVIIPAIDGGYVLLASKVFHPTMFKNIGWGTEHVLSQTREKLESLSFQFAYLDALADIDRPEDLRELRYFPKLLGAVGEDMCARILD